MLKPYDAGLLANYGGHTELWWNYIRTELENAYEFYVEQIVEIEEQASRIRAADRLAYTCADFIKRHLIPTRSTVDDALLNYLRVGQPDGPIDVPTWMAEYANQWLSENPIKN